MAVRKNRVRSLHDRLKLIHEVEKNPGEKRVDIAKRFWLPASTLNYSRQEERYPRTSTDMRCCLQETKKSQSTFAELEAGYKYQSNVNEMANDDGDDFGQNWEELCWSPEILFPELRLLSGSRCGNKWRFNC
jgi:hypothetical protein